MRLSIVGNLVTQTRSQRERPAIFELGNQLAFDTQEHVPLPAPVVRNVPGRVFDHTYAYIPKLLGPPEHFAFLSHLFNCFNLRPISQHKRRFHHLHEMQTNPPSAVAFVCQSSTSSTHHSHDHALTRDLAACILTRLADADPARKALSYVAPVCEKDEYVDRAMVPVLAFTE
jgi:hypothetical protein